MRIAAVVDAETKPDGTISYEITFRNKGQPGLPMDLAEVRKLLAKVLEDFSKGGAKQVMN